MQYNCGCRRCSGEELVFIRCYHSVVQILCISYHICPFSTIHSVLTRPSALQCTTYSHREIDVDLFYASQPPLCSFLLWNSIRLARFYSSLPTSHFPPLMLQCHSNPRKTCRPLAAGLWVRWREELIGIPGWLIQDESGWCYSGPAYLSWLQLPSLM